MQRVASTAAQRIGDEGEDVAAALLEAAGWTVLVRNLRLGRDEVDLLGVDPGPPAALVIVEVRRRGRRDFGLAEETLNRRKRMAELVKYSGTFSDRFPTNDEIEAIDAKRDRNLNARSRR